MDCFAMIGICVSRFESYLSHEMICWFIIEFEQDPGAEPGTSTKVSLNYKQGGGVDEKSET